MIDLIESLRGQSVEICYQGTIYRGILNGASESEVYLQTTQDWVSLPMEGITSIRAAGER
jgi:hypothetical protein